LIGPGKPRVPAGGESLMAAAKAVWRDERCAALETS